MPDRAWEQVAEHKELMCLVAFRDKENRRRAYKPTAQLLIPISHQFLQHCLDSSL